MVPSQMPGTWPARDKGTCARESEPLGCWRFYFQQDSRARSKGLFSVGQKFQGPREVKARGGDAPPPPSTPPSLRSAVSRVVSLSQAPGFPAAPPRLTQPVPNRH